MTLPTNIHPLSRVRFSDRLQRSRRNFPYELHWLPRLPEIFPPPILWGLLGTCLWELGGWMNVSLIISWLGLLRTSPFQNQPSKGPASHHTKTSLYLVSLTIWNYAMLCLFIFMVYNFRTNVILVVTTLQNIDNFYLVEIDINSKKICHCNSKVLKLNWYCSNFIEWNLTLEIYILIFFC